MLIFTKFRNWIDTNPPEYQTEPGIFDQAFRLIHIPKFLILVVIRLYQRLVSPVIAQNTCRFYPSCSHYGYQAVHRHGAVKGSLLAIGRVIRCNPFNPGGYDPVKD